MQAAITFSAPCRNIRPQFITRRCHPSSPSCGTNGCYSAGWCSRTTRASSFFRDAARSRLPHNRRIRRDKSHCCRKQSFGNARRDHRLDWSCWFSRYSTKLSLPCSASRMLRAAVERKFEIIGEALAQLPKYDAAVAGCISEYQRFIAFRSDISALIHGYVDVYDRLVRGIVETKLAGVVRCAGVCATAGATVRMAIKATAQRSVQDPPRFWRVA
jgi:uncharacterized protein with HEPN domain